MAIIHPVTYRDQLRAYWATNTDTDVACAILNACFEDGYFVQCCHFSRIDEFRLVMPEYRVVAILQTALDCKDGEHGLPESVTMVFRRIDHA